MMLALLMEDLDVKFEMNEPIGLEYNGIEVERPILMNRKFNIFLFTATSNETKDKDDWRRAVFIPQIVQQTNRLCNKYYDTCLSIVLCGDEVVVYLGNYTFHQFDRTKGSFSFSIIDYCEHLNICGFGWIYTKLVSLVEYFRVHLESFENDIPILYTATRDPSIFGILHKRLEMNKKLEKKKSKEVGTFKVSGIEKEKKLTQKMNNLRLYK